MEVSPQEAMTYLQGMIVFVVERHGFLKISFLSVLCVECNRRHSYSLRIVRLSGVCYSGRHRKRLCFRFAFS